MIKLIHDHMDEDESTRTCILNLRTRLIFFITQGRAEKDLIKLIYSSSLPPEEIRHDKREDVDREKRMGGSDYFFPDPKYGGLRVCRSSRLW